MYNFIYFIFDIYYRLFESSDICLFNISDDITNFKPIETNLYDNWFNLPYYYQVGNTVGFHLAMLCTIITLILLLYMVYKICKLIICRIANV